MPDNRARRQQTAELIELDLDNWGPRGYAAGQLGSGRALIDRGIPGERVVASWQGRRKHPRGSVIEVLRDSPWRVSPPCPFYLRGCGGCQWQHVAYERQTEIKAAHVRDSVLNAGVPVPAYRDHPMSYPWRYRRTASIALGWEAGFRPRGTRGIVPLTDCPISHPLIGQFAYALNHLLREGSLPNFHARAWLDCLVSGSDSSPSLQVTLQAIQGLTPESNPELDGVAETLSSFPAITSVAYRHTQGDVRPLRGELMSRIQVGANHFHVPSGAFFQANVQMLPLVVHRMRDAIQNKTVRHAADIYGGVGTLGLPLAREMQSLTLIELDAQAVGAAQMTAREWGLPNVRCVSGRAEIVMEELDELDLVIVDPPRLGLDPLVVERLSSSPVPTLLYLSCWPESLARDAALLARQGYELTSLDIFDFYPHTYHVECLAVFENCG